MMARKVTKTTALARRPDYNAKLDKLAAQVKRLATARPKVEVLPAIAQAATVELSDNPILGPLGFQPLTLSPAAEAILAEAVDPERVLILPTGAVYYSHIEYTRWFNRAFGRAQWTLLPAARPKMVEVPKAGGEVKHLATQTFVLCVHGKPIAQATAKQEYHPDNADQDYGDVIEALNANALRRVAKRLGIGLELWDRSWGDAWQASHCVQVWRQGTSKPQWRRKVDPPFYNETGPVEPRTAGNRSRPAQGERSEARTQDRDGDQRTAQERRDAADTRKISEPQVKRFWTIARKAKRTDDEIKGYLRIVCGVEHTVDMERRYYEAACSRLTKPGPMVERAESITSREPGEDG
jgi:Mitochondrial genome maintenance MGM101